MNFDACGGGLACGGLAGGEDDEVDFAEGFLLFVDAVDGVTIAFAGGVTAE